VELLLHIAHRVGVKAEEKVDATLLQYVKKVMGKTRILYKLAKAAKGQPDGVVKEVIYPAVGEQTLDALIREADADEDYARQVRLVTRASYSVSVHLGDRATRQDVCPAAGHAALAAAMAHPLHRALPRKRPSDSRGHGVVVA
jgi:hypothetical protein